MRTDPTFWILARASGLLAYALLTSSVLAGIVLKARPFGAALKAAAVTDLHRFLALLGLGVHRAPRRDAGPRQHRPHLASRPCSCPDSFPTGRCGRPAAFWPASSCSSIYASFALRRRIGTRVWRRLHWLTYAVFALATVHGLAAGTDSGRPWALALYGGAVGAVTAAAGWRALVPATKGGNTHVPDRDRPLAV